MTIMEWAKQYPHVAESIFGCKVEELEGILAEHATFDDAIGYMSTADKSKLDSICSKNE